jgi:hypothetical protein
MTTRRHFLESSTVAAVVARLCSFAPVAAFAQGLPRDGSSGESGTQVSVTSALVEDYIAGKPIADAFDPRAARVFRGTGGQLGILAPAKAFPDAAAHNTLVCYLRDDASISGWSATSATLPDGDRFLDLESPSGFISVVGGSTPKAFIYGKQALYVASLDAGLGPLEVHSWTAGEYSAWPMKSPIDAAYVLERQQLNGTYYMRDVVTLAQTPLLLFSDFLREQSYRPELPMTVLSATPKDVFRGIVVQDTRIVEFIGYASGVPTQFGGQPHVAATAKAGTTFRSAVVREGAAGTIDLLYTLSGPGEETHLYAQSGRYDPTGQQPIIWETALVYTASFPKSALPSDSKPPQVPGFDVVAAGRNDIGELGAVLHTHRAGIGVDGAGQPVNYVTAGDALWGVLCSATQPTASAAFYAPGIVLTAPASEAFEFVRADLSYQPGSVSVLALPRELWTLAGRDEFDIDVMEIPNDTATFVKAGTTRVGVTVTTNGLPTAFADLDVTAQVPVWATLNGKLQLLHPERPVRTRTDMTGRLSVGTRLDAGLFAPDVTVSGPVLGSGYAVRCHPSDHVSNRVIGITQAQLQAVRRDDGSSPFGSFASVFYSALFQVNQAILLLEKAAIDSQRQSAPNPPFRLDTDGSLGAEAIQLNAPRPRPLAVNALELPSWRLTMRNGQLTFTPLTKPAAQQLLSSAFAASVAAGTEIRSAWFGETIFNGIKDGFDVIVSGGKWLLNTVASGLEYGYHFVMDGVQEALNLVGQLFDLMGFGIGFLHGLILDLFFDWDAIKARRNRVRDQIRSDIVGAIGRFGDPVVAARAFAGSLAGIKADAVTALRGLKTNPSVKSGIRSTYKPVSLDALSAFNSEAIRLLFERIFSQFPSLTGEAKALSVQDLLRDGGALMQGIGGVADSLAPGVGELTGLISSWTLAGTLATAPLDPVLDILIQRVDSFFAALAGVTTTAGAWLHDLWANPRSIVDWFDQEIYVPGLSGYYRGLTGKTLSALDLIALAAAVMGADPGSVRGQVQRAAATPAVDFDDVYGVILGIVSAVSSSVVAGIDCQITDAKTYSAAMRYVFIIDALASLSAIARAINKHTDPGAIKISGMMICLLVGVPALIYNFSRASYTRGPIGAVTALLMLVSTIGIAYEDLKEADAKLIAAYSILGFETLAMAGVRAYVQGWKAGAAGRPLNPIPTGVVVGIKFACAATRVGLTA